MGESEENKSKKLLGYTNLTDWFIHEGRNAFVTTNLDIYQWKPEDYQRGRDQLSRVLEAFEKFKEDGILPRFEIERFVTKATVSEWNAETVTGLFSEFKDFIKVAVQDEIKHKL